MNQRHGLDWLVLITEVTLSWRADVCLNTVPKGSLLRGSPELEVGTWEAVNLSV